VVAPAEGGAAAEGSPDMASQEAASVVVVLDFDKAVWEKNRVDFESCRGLAYLDLVVLLAPVELVLLDCTHYNIDLALSILFCENAFNIKQFDTLYTLTILLPVMLLIEQVAHNIKRIRCLKVTNSTFWSSRVWPFRSCRDESRRSPP
jgi:hypothetical protein